MVKNLFFTTVVNSHTTQGTYFSPKHLLYLWRCSNANPVGHELSTCNDCFNCLTQSLTGNWTIKFLKLTSLSSKADWILHGGALFIIYVLPSKNKLVFLENEMWLFTFTNCLISNPGTEFTKLRTKICKIFLNLI